MVNCETKHEHIQTHKYSTHTHTDRQMDRRTDRQTDKENGRIYNTLNSLPCEPTRVIPDRWKGMSPEQLGKIWETQGIQREERKVGVNHEATLNSGRITLMEHDAVWGHRLCF